MALALGLGALLAVGGAGMLLRRPDPVHIVPVDPEIDADATSTATAFRDNTELLPNLHAATPELDASAASNALFDVGDSSGRGTCSPFGATSALLPNLPPADLPRAAATPEIDAEHRLGSGFGLVDCGVITEGGPCNPHGITPAFRLQGEVLPRAATANRNVRLPRPEQDEEEEEEEEVAAASAFRLRGEVLPRAVADRTFRLPRPEQDEEDDDEEEDVDDLAANQNHGERVVFPVVDCGGVMERGPCNPHGITDIYRPANADTNRALRFRLTRLPRAAARPDDDEDFEEVGADPDEEEEVGATSAASAFRLTAEVLPSAAADRVHADRREDQDRAALYPAVDCNSMGLGRGGCHPHGITPKAIASPNADHAKQGPPIASGRLHRYLLPIILMIAAVIVAAIILQHG